MDAAAFLTIAIPVVVAIITALTTIYIARRKAKEDLSTSITQGFKELTDQLQEERVWASEEIRKHKELLAECEARSYLFERQLRRVMAYIDRAEVALEKAGINIPKFERPPEN